VFRRVKVQQEIRVHASGTIQNKFEIWYEVSYQLLSMTYFVQGLYESENKQKYVAGARQPRLGAKAIY